MFSYLFQPVRLHSRTWMARCTALLFVLSTLLWQTPSYAQEEQPAVEQAAGARPKIHLPYFSDGANPWQGTIFWLGKVERASNYADVRIAYDDEAILFYLHVFDRQSFYDAGANSASDLTKWDGASVYLDTQGDLAAPLSSAAFRFDAQINHWEPRTAYQRAFRWNKGSWQAAAASFDTKSGYRGGINDAAEDRGWNLRFRIPFASIGQSGAPKQGSVWRMAVVLHDRDEPQGPALADQVWPRDMQAGQPQSWGHIGFGVRGYQAPNVAEPQQLVIRNGVNGVSAPDSAVGGHSICGEPFRSDFFGKWGNANYPGYKQFNIQNQSDIADFPCFSKYYVTFPLNSLPREASIVKATLTMHMFGNAGYGGDDAKSSYIQAARVAEDWNEQTLTWNNAPQVLENYSSTWVEPLKDGGIANTSHTWDLARAVADAHAAGEPLRLVLYSLDGEYHSGKYFWSADSDVAEGRPSLEITWGYKTYTMSVLPHKQVIRSGDTAVYELNFTSLRDGETVRVEAGASSPAGLEVKITPQQINAPGGTATVTLTDRSGANGARMYRVPLTARQGEEVRNAEMFVFVNGRQVFLPAVRR